MSYSYIRKSSELTSAMTLEMNSLKEFFAKNEAPIENEVIKEKIKSLFISISKSESEEKYLHAETRLVNFWDKLIEVLTPLDEKNLAKLEEVFKKEKINFFNDLFNLVRVYQSPSKLNVERVFKKLLEEESFDKVFKVSAKITEIAKMFSSSEKVAEKNTGVTLQNLVYQYQISVLVANDQIDEAFERLQEIRDLQTKKNSLISMMKDLNHLADFEAIEKIIEASFPSEDRPVYSREGFWINTKNLELVDKSSELEGDRNLIFGKLAEALIKNNFLEQAERVIGKMNKGVYKDLLLKDLNRKKPSVGKRLVSYFKK